MSGFIVVFFISIVVMYADYRMTYWNSNVRGNGLGSIPRVLAGEAVQPMQYRVLVPWLTSIISTLFGGKDLIDLKKWESTIAVLTKPYIVVRCLAILFSLTMAHLWFGNLLYTSLLALFFVGASIFDYTDGYLEVGFFALSFYLMREQGYMSIALILVVVFMAALNRETAIFLPICAALSGFYFTAIAMGMAFMVGYMIPRIYYGDKKRYCKFNMIKENIRRIRKGLFRIEYILFLVLLGLVIYAYIKAMFVLSPLEVGMGMMFITLLIPTVWSEIRVHKPVMLVLIPMLMR